MPVSSSQRVRRLARNAEKWAQEADKQTALASDNLFGRMLWRRGLRRDLEQLDPGAARDRRYASWLGTGVGAALTYQIANVTIPIQAMIEERRWVALAPLAVTTIVWPLPSLALVTSLACITVSRAYDVLRTPWGIGKAVLRRVKSARCERKAFRLARKQEQADAERLTLGEQWRRRRARKAAEAEA